MVGARLAHGDPGVGDDAIGTFDGLYGIGANGNAGLLILHPLVDVGFGQQLFGAGNREFEIEASGRVHPRGGNVVAVADHATFLPLIGPLCSSNVITSAMIWQGWVLSVRPLTTGIDAYFARSSQRLMRVGADHNRVRIAERTRAGVGDALAAAELQIVLVSSSGLAAELAHRDIERDARAGRRLLEDHDEDVVFDALGPES